MPTSDDLAGLGLPMELSAVLGYNPSNLTCTGTTQATAAAALGKNVTVNAQTSQTGAIIAASSKIGTPHYFSNGTASTTTALIYAPVGHTLNGVASTTPYTLAQNAGVFLFQASLKNWFSSK